MTGIPRECGGEPNRVVRVPDDIWVFPANAGVSPGSDVFPGSNRGIPRECGGEPATKTGLPSSTRYSPRMRG